MTVGFYVTMKRDKRVAWLAGPFESKESAEQMVNTATLTAYDVDPKTWFDLFGVTRVEIDSDKTLPPGVLNDRLGLAA